MKVVTVLLVGFLADVFHVEAHLFPPLPEGECGEPQPDGLTAILNDFSETFPTYEFLAVFLEALSEDGEVVNVLSLLMTEEFNNLINKVGDLDEWVEITDIFCDDLQFNINFYLNVLGDLFKVIPIDPSTPKSTTRSRPGIIGLAQDIIDILPLEEWQPKFRKLEDSNVSLLTAIHTIKGSLFKDVVAQITQMEEFILLREHLRVLGVPVDCGISRFQKMLGWSYSTCACGTLRTMNQC